MTNLLLRRFVKDHQNTDSPAVRSAIGTLSGAVGIGCNVLLCLGKLAAGALAGSVSITADAMNNLSDASGSVATLIGFRVAGKPADEKHPYGHARAEYLSGLAMAMLILLIGVELAKSSLDKILHPVPVECSAVTVGVLLASIAVKLWMFWFNRGLSRQIHSAALQVTAADSRNDCLTTAAVLLAAIVERYLDLRVDGFVGMAVAVFILVSGWNLAQETISPLLGENAAPELRESLAEFISRQPKVLGYHDLLVHDYGPGQRFATLHVEMDHREDPMECHEIIDELERQCLRQFHVHLVIHYDPVVVDDPVLTALRQRVESLLREVDDRLSLHDFRMVRGRRHTNVIFDVAMPSDLRGRESEITQLLEDRLNVDGETIYHLVITYDMALAT